MTEKKINESNDHSFFSVKLIDNGIVHVNLNYSVEIDIEAAKKIINAIGELCRDKKRPVLISSDHYSAPTPEARKYIAEAESNPYSKASAYLARTLAERILTNAFIRFNKPARPTKMFTSKSKAIDWLKTFL